MTPRRPDSLCSINSPPGDVLGWFRDRRRKSRPRASDRLLNLYIGLVFLVAPFAFWVNVVLTGPPLLETNVAYALRQDMASLLPAALLLFCFVRLRSWVWRGPVAVEEPDLGWILAMPVDRAAVLRPLLGRSLLRAVIEGVSVGALLWLALTAIYDLGFVPALAGASILSSVATSVLMAGVGTVAEGVPAIATGVVRMTPAVLAAAVGMAYWGGWWVLESLIAWSGPWGWASSAILFSVPPGSGGLAPLALLVGVAILAAFGCRQCVGQLHLEQLAEHSLANRAFSAAMYFLEFRDAARLRRSRLSGKLARPLFWLPVPQSRWLVIPWAGALLLGRSRYVRGRVAACCLTYGLLGLAAASQLLQAVSAYLLFGIASQILAFALVEPMRREHEEGFASRLLELSRPAVMRRHMIAPAIVQGLLTALVGAILMFYVGASVIHFGVVGIALGAVPSQIAIAGFAALRSGPDAALLLQGETGAQMWVAQLLGPVQLSFLIVCTPFAIGLSLAPAIGHLAILLILLVQGVIGMVTLAWFKSWLERFLYYEEH